MQFLLLFFRLHALRQNFMRTNKKRLETEVSSLFGGDKRDRTADLLNAILSPAHFSRKTGRKRPVFSGFLPPFREAVRSNSTRIPLFSRAFSVVRMAGDFPPSPGAGRRARPCVSRLCAPKGVKNRGRIRVMRHSPFGALRSGPLIHPMWENPGIGQTGISGNICCFSNPNRGKIRVMEG